MENSKEETKDINAHTGYDDDGNSLNYQGNILPLKEEPKREFVGNTSKWNIGDFEATKPHSFCETPEEKCTMNYCDENGCQNRKRELVEPKQETLEESAKEFFRKFKHTHSPDNYYLALVEFAKWNQERMYSEEEVLEHLNKLLLMPNSELDTFTDDEEMVTMKWFEQFSKLKNGGH